MGAASSGPARGRGVFHVKHCAKDPRDEAMCFDEDRRPPGAGAAPTERVANTDPQLYPQSGAAVIRLKPAAPTAARRDPGPAGREGPST